MKWVSTLQNFSSLEKSIRQAVAECAEKLGTDSADIGFLFVSSEYRDDLIDLWPVLRKDIKIKHLIGCTAGGVIGDGNEIEQELGLSLTAAVLPDVEITPFHVLQENLPDADKSPRFWRELIKVDNDPLPNFLIFSDPFSLDLDSLLSGLDFSYPQSQKVGGLASGGQAPKENLLLLDDKIYSKGSVGVSFSGNIRMEAVVAQGCRPIGAPISITQSDENVLISVNNQSPLEYVQSLYETLSPRDQSLLQTSLFLGIIMDPYKNQPKQGDFLIRNIIGLDESKGFMAIGARLRVGQTVQFHLRDADTSHDDLKFILSHSASIKEMKKSVHSSKSGAVLFSCVGRGKRLYGKPNHDSTLFKSVMGNIPVGGFFCNGEIGPVDGKTYLHGYTSSIAVFSPKETN